MEYQGVLQKMNTENGETIQYYLEFEHDFINLNQVIGKKVGIRFEKFQCVSCSKNKKIFRQGFCYDCFYEQPQAGEWILKPELSTAHLGIEDRDLEYEKAVQLKPHIVYLALSSDVKVGVTRKTQVPTRWIDQGANQALAILEVPNRYLAGIAEVALKKYVSDKTSWQKMLKNEVVQMDLKEKLAELIDNLPKEVLPYLKGTDEPIYNLSYPIDRYPSKVKSLNIVTKQEYEGILQGIKGQYLIFDDDTVFNVRNNEGIVVTLTIDNNTKNNEVLSLS
ncbi:MAG: DUF2797 domain-containing protein [Flavicella sp.]